jgi:hypothetical protein
VLFLEPRHDVRRLVGDLDPIDHDQILLVIASESEAIDEATRKHEWIASLRSQ